jgi:hypothetical protein
MRNAFCRRTMRVAFLAIAVSAAAGCGSSDSANKGATVTTTSGTAPSAATSVPDTGPFTSVLYGYKANSPDWTGTPATTPWDGRSAPSSGDPNVDALQGPKWERSTSVLPYAERVWAVAAETSLPLERFASDFRAANNSAHPCTAAPAKRAELTVAGEPAFLDEDTCPPDAPVFVLTATVVHAGRGYVFFAFDQTGAEEKMRSWFTEFLRTLEFTS